MCVNVGLSITVCVCGNNGFYMLGSIIRSLQALKCLLLISVTAPTTPSCDLNYTLSEGWGKVESD